MDNDFILIAVIAFVIIGLIILFVWMKSRGRRLVVNAVKQVQEALKLTIYVGAHPQLDAVWIAVRGQISGLTIRIFGGRSRRGRNLGVAGGISAMVNPIDRGFVLVVVTLPITIPFRFTIQRRQALSTPRFGTSYEEFDKNVEVNTDNEKKALTLLNNEQLRDAIVSFIKLTSSAYVTTSEVMIKVPGDKQILPFAREAINLALILGNQIKTIQ